MSRKPYHSRTATDEAIAHIKTDWLAGKSLKEIAHLYGVDQGNLTRAFRNAHQRTPKEYIDRRRMEYIHDRLSRDHVFGYQLATELGLASDMSFYRWIKRTHGLSFAKVKQHMRKQADRKRKVVTIKRNNKG